MFDLKRVPHCKFRQVEGKELLGKTIVQVDDSSVNCLNIECSDGSVYCLESENVCSLAVYEVDTFDRAYLDIYGYGKGQ